MKALLFHGPGDLRLEEVPRPEAGPGDVLVHVEVALTDGTDLKAFRRGHPVLLGELPSPFGHEFCGVDVETGRRVVAAQALVEQETVEPPQRRRPPGDGRRRQSGPLLPEARQFGGPGAGRSPRPSPPGNPASTADTITSTATTPAAAHAGPRRTPTAPTPTRP